MERKEKMINNDNINYYCPSCALFYDFTTPFFTSKRRRPSQIPIPELTAIHRNIDRKSERKIETDTRIFELSITVDKDRQKHPSSYFLRTRKSQQKNGVDIQESKGTNAHKEEKEGEKRGSFE